jgi:hypothetical protein
MPTAKRTREVERPLWVLLPGAMPVRVEARNRGSLFKLATHWCHEGDEQWTRVGEDRKESAA